MQHIALRPFPHGYRQCHLREHQPFALRVPTHAQICHTAMRGSVFDPYRRKPFIEPIDLHRFRAAGAQRAHVLSTDFWCRNQHCPTSGIHALGFAYALGQACRVN